MLDGEYARSYDQRGALVYESGLSASQLHTLAACLGGALELNRAFSLERSDDAPRPGQPSLLVLSATPREAELSAARMVLHVEPRSFRVSRAYFFEPGGVRHRVKFGRLEARVAAATSKSK